MRRFYADERGIQDGLAYLAPEDARHALRVLRMVPGDAAELLHDGRRYAATVAAADDASVALRVGQELPSTEPTLRVTLYQGLPKGEKMELIVQKAVELGVARVVPVAMCRCVVRLDVRDGHKKQERWQKIAREACKQSGRCALPQVEAPISFDELTRRLPGHALALVPWEDAQGTSLSACYRAHPTVNDVAVVIGPEGGIAAEEIARLQEAGCLPVTLGPRILRTETAGICAISALMCLYGEME